jgi:hypothetical protein
MQPFLRSLVPTPSSLTPRRGRQYANPLRLSVVCTVHRRLDLHTPTNYSRHAADRDRGVETRRFNFLNSPSTNLSVSTWYLEGIAGVVVVGGGVGAWVEGALH